MRISITDPVTGITSEMLINVTYPYITSRKMRIVGMGLAFLRQQTGHAGGSLKIDSTEGQGTRVEALFIMNHINRQPVGDIPEVLKILIIANPGIEFVNEHKTDSVSYRIDTKEIKEIIKVEELGDKDLMEEIRNKAFENLNNSGAQDLCIERSECM